MPRKNSVLDGPKAENLEKIASLAGSRRTPCYLYRKKLPPMSNAATLTEPPIAEVLERTQKELRAEATAIEKLRQQIQAQGAAAPKADVAEFAKRQKAFLDRKIDFEKQRKAAGNLPASQPEESTTPSTPPKPVLEVPPSLAPKAVAPKSSKIVPPKPSKIVAPKPSTISRKTSSIKKPQAGAPKNSTPDVSATEVDPLEKLKAIPLKPAPLTGPPPVPVDEKPASAARSRPAMPAPEESPARVAAYKPDKTRIRIFIGIILLALAIAAWLIWG
jgi:hypothetical protein